MKASPAAAFGDILAGGPQVFCHEQGWAPAGRCPAAGHMDGTPGALHRRGRDGVAALVPPPPAGSRTRIGHLLTKMRSLEVIQTPAPQLDLAQEVALPDELEIHHTGQAEAPSGARTPLASSTDWNAGRW